MQVTGVNPLKFENKMQAITPLLSSLFGSNTDSADSEMQQRVFILEQFTTKQKVTDLIHYGLVLVLGSLTIVITVRKK